MNLKDTGPGGTTCGKRIGLKDLRLCLSGMEYDDFATSIFRVEEYDVCSRFS
jgi:hypothetical protein